MKNSLEQQITELNITASEELAKGNLEKSLSLIEKSEKIIKSLNEQEKKQNCSKLINLNYGKYFIASEDYQKAGNYLEDLLKFSYSLLTESELLETLLNLCTVYSKTSNFSKLLQKSHQGLLIASSNPASGALLHYYVGLSHQNMNNFAEAEKAYKESLSISNSSLGLGHPTTTLVMKKYLRFLKINSNHKQIPNTSRSIAVSSKANSRLATSTSKRSKNTILPSIRGSLKEPESLLVPIFSKKGPLRSKPSGDRFKEILTPAKSKAPESSCRIRNRRASADVSLSRSTQVIKKLDISKIIMIQKSVRGYLARKRLKELKRKAVKGKVEKAVADLNDLKAQILILKTVEHKSHDFYKAEYAKQDVVHRVLKYIVRIQKSFRMVRQKKKFLAMKKSAFKIQSLVKMYLVRSLYQKILLAIRFIQRSWREFKSCKCN